MTLTLHCDSLEIINIKIKSYMLEQNQWMDFLEKDLSCVIDPEQQLGAVYISSLPTAQNLSLLQNAGIKSVISAAKGVRLSLVAPYLHSHLVLSAEDHDDYDLSQFFHLSFEFIEKARREGNVLVHCMAGISRSATIVAAYLIKKNFMKASEAVSHLQNRRKQICPNPGFLEQLRRFEASVFSQSFNRKCKTQSSQQKDKAVQKVPLSNLFMQNSMKPLSQLQKKQVLKLKEEKPSLTKESYFNNFSLCSVPDFVKETQIPKAEKVNKSIILQRNSKERMEMPVSHSQALQQTSQQPKRSKTLEKIQRLKASMVVKMASSKLQCSANFNRLLKDKIYKNKLKIR